MSTTETPFRGKTIFDEAVNFMDLLFDGPVSNGLLRSDAQLLSRFGNPGEIEFELPGVKKEDIKLTTERSGPYVHFKVQGKRGSKILTGFRAVRADEIDMDNIKSKYEDGVLTVTIQKRKDSKKYNREIQIE